jgi:hypothetical protein
MAVVSVSIYVVPQVGTTQDHNFSEFLNVVCRYLLRPLNVGPSIKRSLRPQGNRLRPFPPPPQKKKICE